jgi:hypothetical protein
MVRLASSSDRNPVFDVCDQSLFIFFSHINPDLADQNGIHNEKQ